MADAIRALRDSPGDTDAVAAARAAYDALTEDQQKLVPEDVLSKLTTAEASIQPTPVPTTKPTVAPTAMPTAEPTAKPTAKPTTEPADKPTAKPTTEPSAKPTAEPTAKPTVEPTVKPTAEPTAKPTAEPTATPTAEPTAAPTAEPTATPTAEPTATPTAEPTATPTAEPTATPTAEPTATPTAEPTSTPKVDLSKCKVTGQNQTYTGKALKPAVVVKYCKVKLKQGTDYTVSYKNNVKPGKATVTVKGKGNYTGSAKVSFAIRVPLSKCKVTVKSQTYTGKALKPAVSVKFGKTKLKMGTDYTVTYKNNKKIGLATATVKGKGKYSGSKKITFRINPKGTACTKLTGGNQQISLKWKKEVDRYEKEIIFIDTACSSADSVHTCAAGTGILYRQDECDRKHTGSFRNDHRAL